MPDREKVIKGLECLAQQPSNGTCSECAYFRPFRDDPDCGWCDKVAIAADALALLRGQEPRVLTLEEVQNDCPDYVYLEWLNCCVCCIKDEGESNKSVGYFAYGIEGYYYQFLWDTYGIRWRCWTAMPTDEQRKVVKWDE